MKMIFEITDQFLFCLVSLKCSKELCIIDSHKNIHELFTKATEELEKIGEWFKANKLKKLRTRFFQKISIKDDLPLKVPDLKIAINQIERKKAIKFPSVKLGENVNW